MVETLFQLEQYLHMHEIATDQDVYVSPREWLGLAGWIAPYHIVAATPEEPAFFWFLGRRIRQLRSA